MQLSDNMKGALFMSAGMVSFTVNDTFVKAVSDELPLMQVISLRGVAVTAVLVVATLVTGAHRVRLGARDRGLIVLRTLAEIGGTFFFLTALFHMPIANISAILQSLPLVVTLGSALVFREPVGWRRWTAIGVGFLGVMLIVRPGTEGFTVYSVYGLISVLMVAVRDLAARRLSPEVPSLVVSVAAGGGVAVFGLVGSLGVEWQPVSHLAGAQVTGAVAALLVGYVTVVMAMRVGEIGAVAPFRYTSLLAALILGALVFGQFPGAVTLLGAAIVVATGVFTLWRERRVRRRGPVPLRLR